MLIKEVGRLNKSFARVMRTRVLMILMSLAVIAFPLIAQAENKGSQNAENVATTETLTFLSSNMMPFGAMDDGKPIGFTVDILREVMRRLGRTDNIEFNDWKSAYDRSLTEANTVLWPPSRTPEREDLFKWVGPLIPEKIILFARKDSELVVNSLEDAKKVGGIATVMDFASEKLLKEKGFNNLVSQRSYLQGPDALKFGRVDLWISSNITMEQTALSANVDPKLFEPLLVVKEIPSYLAFSKSVPDEVVNQWQTTLDEMKRDGTWEKIVTNWIPAELLRIGSKTVNYTEKEQLWIEAHRTVKVVDFFQEPPFTIDLSDSRTGYLYELLNEALNIAGLRPEFMGNYTSYDAMVDDLQKGTVDILTTMENTRQPPDAIVKTVPVVKTPYALVARLNSPEIIRTSDLFGRKVAVVKGYAQDRHLDKFPRIKKVHVKNNEEGFEAVRMGTAEYFLNNVANTGYVLKKTFATDLRIAGTLSYVDFPPLTLSFGIHGKDTALPEIINKALAAVPIDTLSRLRDKWLPEEFIANEPDRISLTSEEQAFLEAHPVIRVHNEQNWAPFNFYENGTATGFSIDYMNLLAKKIGFNIEYVSGPTWSEFISMTKDHRLDVMLNIVKTEERQKFLRYTRQPYIETPRAIVVRKDNPTVNSFKDLHGKTVAVEKDFFYEGYLKKNHPKINVITVKNTAETLRAVVNGDADATLGVIAVEQFLIRSHFFTNLKLVIDSEEKALRSFPQFIGVRKDWPLLANMLDKAMAEVTDKERVTLSRKWIVQENLSRKINLSSEERAFLSDHPVLRVSNEMAYPPFDFAVNGIPTGYSIDYLNLLAERLGVRLEYVNGYPWNELLSMFERRELDIIHSAMKTDDRLRYTDFTKPYTRLLHALVTRNDDHLKSLDDLRGKTLALQKGYATNDYILPRYPDTNILWVGGTLEGLKAVAAGQADAVVDAQSVASYLIQKHFLTNLKIANRVDIWQGDEQDLRIGARSDWPLLKDILEKAMDTVTRSEETALQKKWFGLDREEIEVPEVVLTKEEQDYLEKHSELRFAFDVDWPPVEFSGKDFGMHGIAADYLQRMSELLGVAFKPSQSQPWKEMLTAVKSGELDFFSALASTPQRREWLDFTNSYLSFPIVILTNKDVPYIGSLSELMNKPVAVVEDYASQEFLLENHRDLTLLPVENVKEGLMAVSTGKAFAFIASLATASHVMSREGLTDLKVSGETPYSYNLSMGVRKEDTVLLNILDKALAAISPQERNVINSKWTSVTYEHAINYSLIWRIVAGALVILIFVLYWNSRLKKEIAERKRAEEAAGSANQAKSEFLANMSHELRTPLNAILGFAQIMERNPNISSEKENLKIIQRSGNHLLTLINQVLDLSKIEAGHIALEESSFDLLHLLDELENMLSLKADKDHLSLFFDCAPEVPRHIRTDEVKLRQALINLLSNAIKFTDQGSVRLRVSLKNHGDPAHQGKSIEFKNRQNADGQCTIHFEIEDTGPGIAPEEMGHLFEAFGQTSAGRETREGTGLGLLISHKFVQLMGGDMHVTSKVGQGTTFSFDIQVEVTTVSDVTSEQPINRAIGLQPGQQPLRMLIVDDKQDNRQLLFELLNPFGFDLLEAENGQEAVDIVERWKPHLIWMDMRMPVMDGYEATERIRELKTSLPYPVVIAVTASVFEENRATVMAVGCDDIVVKPFQEADIVAMLQKHLDVKFLYSNDEMCTAISSLDKIKPGLNVEDFNDLPQEIITQLKASVATLEIDTVMAVVEEIKGHNLPLAEALKPLVEGYRFDKLQKFLEGIQQA